VGVPETFDAFAALPASEALQLVTAKAHAALTELAQAAGGQRTTFGATVIRQADGTFGTRFFASVGEAYDPAEIVWHADTPAEAFAVALERVQQKAAESRVEVLRREAAALGFNLTPVVEIGTPTA
jgi:hypothetical protein